MKRLICILLLLCLALSLLPAGAEDAAEETGLEKFAVKHGNRNSPKIAITMDDCNERDWAWKAVELCREYGITMTFFPNGYNLHEEDREGWLNALDAGCEIASHGQSHYYLRDTGQGTILFRLGYFQQVLDKVLGFHYQVRWFRPPFGKYADSDGSSTRIVRIIRQYGYDHVLLWDVSETNANKLMKKVKNGSILLFHARKKDYNCLAEAIPKLLEAGFQPVTVSELFGFDPPETSEELYIYNKDDFKSK